MTFFADSSLARSRFRCASSAAALASLHLRLVLGIEVAAVVGRFPAGPSTPRASPGPRPVLFLASVGSICTSTSSFAHHAAAVDEHRLGDAAGVAGHGRFLVGHQRAGQTQRVAAVDGPRRARSRSSRPRRPAGRRPVSAGGHAQRGLGTAGAQPSRGRTRRRRPPRPPRRQSPANGGRSTAAPCSVFARGAGRSFAADLQPRLPSASFRSKSGGSETTADFFVSMVLTAIDSHSNRVDSLRRPVQKQFHGLFGDLHDAGRPQVRPKTTVPCKRQPKASVVSRGSTGRSSPASMPCCRMPPNLRIICSWYSRCDSGPQPRNSARSWTNISR